ncbi:hypothetical protein EVA_01932 [gut metagenome]|uniref:Uncharacterized protein n=1 Tax=gut metagenome TaxID=749906 RepID=J9GQ85_9ZZZZ
MIILNLLKFLLMPRSILQVFIVHTNEIKNRIEKPRDARNFAEGVRLLKRERVQADYELRSFSDVESLECIMLVAKRSALY